MYAVEEKDMQMLDTTLNLFWCVESVLFGRLIWAD